MSSTNPMFRKEKNNYLITGASSGLGKYLHDQLGGSTFSRKKIKGEASKIIIHCAFNKTRDVNSQNLYQYLFDNVFLTEKLTKIPHEKFIYISSVDVYPKDNQRHSENEVIDIDKVSSIYAIVKLMAESVILNCCQNFLIVRCGALLGRDVKENSLMKIIKNESPTLSLSGDSVCNYVSHSSVLAFVKLAVKNDLQGIYNLASSENITLSEIADLFQKEVRFGEYTYTVGNIDNNKVKKLLPVFKKTTREIISEFLPAIS